LYSRPTTAICDCGYRLKDTGDYYTNSVSTEFSSSSSSEAYSNLSSSWTIVNGSRPQSNNALTLDYESSNVWIENGSLMVRQVAYPANASSSTPVSGAEIETVEQNILHGSFRVTASLEYESDANEKGFVFGWFFYYDDDNEIDIEVLGREGINSVQYTTQPTTDANGNNITGASVAGTLSTPSTSMQEYRFDWVPSLVRFYQGTKLSHSTTVNVPSVSGSLRLNLWSTGNSFSGTTSTVNVTASVNSLVLYYNTSASEAGNDSSFNNQCSQAGGVKSETAICVVDDTKGSGSVSKHRPRTLWTSLFAAAAVPTVVLNF